jgi:hypothetical protein
MRNFSQSACYLDDVALTQKTITAAGQQDLNRFQFDLIYSF